MNEKVIKLADAEEVCDFDIDITDQSAVIDAKSILGVMGFGMQKRLIVTYGGEDVGFEDVLRKYAVA